MGKPDKSDTVIVAPDPLTGLYFVARIFDVDDEGVLTTDLLEIEHGHVERLVGYDAQGAYYLVQLMTWRDEMPWCHRLATLSGMLDWDFYQVKEYWEVAATRAWDAFQQELEDRGAEPPRTKMPKGVH